MVGFFGKTPMQGDFIKNGTASAIAGHFMRWLTDGVEAAARAKSGLPESPVGFLYSHESQNEVLVGAFVRSNDSVGRDFPLAIFTSLNADLAAQHLSAVPRAYDHFLNEAVNILTMSTEHDHRSLCHLTEGLVPPEASTLPPMHAVCLSEVQAMTMADFHGQVGTDLRGQHYYAFHAMMSSCLPLRGKGPGGAGVITLECPVPSPTMGALWLEFATSLLQWRTAPSLFWTSGEPRHIYLSLGNPPAAILTYLAGGDPNASKKWPLQTDSAAAITFARDKLAPDFLAIIDMPATTLGQVLEIVKR